MNINKDGIAIHNEEDFQKMRVSGKLAAEILDKVCSIIEPGITTNQINDFCHDMIIKAGAIPAPLNYKGFPKSICTSVNNVVCHGIPNDKPLKEGDILNIDVTVIVDGWHGDTSRMYWVGKKIPIAAQRVTKAAYECLIAGLEHAKPGKKIGDIGHAIETHAKKYNYSVVRGYCGHGIGKIFHDLPNVPHYGKAGIGITLEEGMFFTIEPMLNIGSYDTRINPIDKWTVTTKDHSLSAQFEHTIGITSDGHEIFTTSPMKMTQPPYNL